MRDVPILKLGAIMLVAVHRHLGDHADPRLERRAGSTAADDIDPLLDVLIVLSSFVFSVVMTCWPTHLACRAKPGDESDGEPIHGNTRLEIAWTAIPTVIVPASGAYSWIVLDDIEAKASETAMGDVTAQQFAWRFDYPERADDLDELHVPVDRSSSRAPRARRPALVLGPRVADQEGPRPGRSGTTTTTTSS